MPKYSTLIFDLDGTLADPALGMVRCMNYALTRFDYSPLPDVEITAHVGPPLEQTVGKLTGSDDVEHITAVVAAYRERYGEFGYRENTLYDDIPQMLEALHAAGRRLIVCTSKLEKYAIKVLQTLEIEHYFQLVCGSNGPEPKSEQLKQLLLEDKISSSALMIGDRAVDLTAAHSNGLASAAVLWGYGSHQELQAENPAYTFSTPDELASSLLQV